MIITEKITPVNAEKTFMGGRDIRFTLDTETKQVGINTPAMFTDPVVTLDDLQEVVRKLAVADQTLQQD